MTLANRASTTPPDLQGWRRQAFGVGIAVFRIILGLVFLTNGLSKVGFDFPVLPGFLIDYDGAKGILAHNIQDHPVGVYKDFVQNVILDNYTPFGILLTVTELAVGVMLVSGAFANVGALIGAGSILHINFSTLDGWHTGPWAWEEAPLWGGLLLLAIIGAGRYYGLDPRVTAMLPPRLRRWPLSS